MGKITIERETLELAASLIQPLTGKGDREVYDALRAALAQKAEPDEQEVALQEIAEFGQDQLREPRTQEEKEQYAFEDWLASECPSGSVEAVQRQWEESAEYLELQDDTPAQPAPAAVPPGYVLVPVEPTYEINKAIRMAVRAGCFDDGIYRAMIAAAGDKP